MDINNASGYDDTYQISNTGSPTMQIYGKKTIFYQTDSS